jgi:TRAP-type C4-dicarboxylate transport system substrate-binding protein
MTFAMRFASRCVAVAACVLLIECPVVDSSRAQELKISHQWKAEIDARDRALRVFVAEVAKLAPHLQLAVYPDSSLKIAPIDQFDKLVTGELAMCVYPMIYAIPKLPELAITLFPFIPADLDMAMQLKGTPFQRKLTSFLEAHGAHVLTWWWLAGGVASRQREIAGPDSVKGLRIRLPDPSWEKMLAVAGARSAPRMTSPEVADAMRDGRIDGVMTSLESLVGFRVYEHSGAAMIGGLAGFMSFQPLLISKVVWDGLSVDEKNALEVAAEAADAYFVPEQRDAERKAKDAFAGAGAKIHTLKIDEYEAWLKIAKDTVWPQYRKLTPEADELFVALMTSVIRSDSGAKGSRQPSAARGN